MTRDIASILGCVYSGVGVSRAALGKQVDAFEADLRAALLEANPSGVFKEQVETAVFIAPRADVARLPEQRLS